MSEPLTPERLAELRRIAEFDPPTCLALLDEIERLRRERDVLAEAFKHVLTCEDCECATCPQGTGLAYRAYRALGGALSGTTHDAEE